MKHSDAHAAAGSRVTTRLFGSLCQRSRAHRGTKSVAALASRARAAVKRRPLNDREQRSRGVADAERAVGLLLRKHERGESSELINRKLYLI
ncbi:hypothetical protein EVAR_35564_1 [Eumeta japonica]|uniref:Uncharacterized protein n=1 Tax=Eumeta variegata TaxID=151549 RepID=A0A4C1XPP7_EUMVA|nr:hypothetical protein EVAR_35564_1 [Eumeta japonica]